MSATDSFVLWPISPISLIWVLIALAVLIGIISLLLELLASRRPFLEGLSAPARRAWRLSGFSLLALTAALTLNFWLHAQRTGGYWSWEPVMTWALILWLLLLAYRRSRFQLALTRGQLSALSLTTLAFFLIEAGLLIIALIR